MSIRELSPVLLKKAQDELGEVPSRIPQDLKSIKEWLAKQPHINANLDDQWLLAFLRGSKFSLERTKEKLENFYTAKTLVPEVLMIEDPAVKEFRENFRLGGCVCLKKPITEDGLCVVIFRTGVYNPDTYSIAKHTQLGITMLEIMMLENDNAVVAGVKHVLDLKNVTMKHISSMTPMLAKKIVTNGEGAIPLRQKGIHMINPFPGLEIAYNLVAKMSSEKLRKRMIIHGKDSNDLFDYIPKECLPVECGGTGEPISELIDYWEEKILSYRDYIIKSQQFKTDESKRIGKSKIVEDSLEFNGSFRSLDVD